MDGMQQINQLMLAFEAIDQGEALSGGDGTELFTARTAVIRTSMPSGLGAVASRDVPPIPINPSRFAAFEIRPKPP